MVNKCVRAGGLALVPLLLLATGLACGNAPVNLGRPAISVNEHAATSDSIMLLIANSNNIEVKTRCQIAPSKGRSSAGWHTIGGVPDVPANETLEYQVRGLESPWDYAWEYEFRCQFHKQGLPTGRLSPYSGIVSGSTLPK